MCVWGPQTIPSQLCFYSQTCHWGVLSCRGQYKQCFLTGGHEPHSPTPLRGKTRCTWGLLNPFVLKKLRQYKRKWSRKNTFSKTWVVHCDQVTKESTLQIIYWQIEWGASNLGITSCWIMFCGNENLSWWRNFYHGTKIYHIQLMTWSFLTGFPCMTGTAACPRVWRVALQTGLGGDGLMSCRTIWGNAKHCFSPAERK